MIRRASDPLAKTMALLAAVVVAAGCGGDDGGGSDGSGDDGAATTTEQEPTSEDEGVDEPTADGESVDGTDEVSGQTVFANNCQACHGTKGAGGHVGPNLQTSDVADDPERVERIVREGSGRMPAFEQTLDDDEIAAVVEYVSQDLAPLE